MIYMTSKTIRWNIWRSFVTRWPIFLHAGTPFSITRQELLSKVPYDSFGLFYVSVSSLLLLLTDARGRSDSSPVGSNCKRKFQMTFLRKQYITINPRKYQYSSIISQFFGYARGIYGGSNWLNLSARTFWHQTS